MHVHDEIAHERVVHGALCRSLPSIIGEIVARIDADDVKRGRVAEFGAVHGLQLTAEDEMQELAIPGLTHLKSSYIAAAPGHARLFHALIELVQPLRPATNLYAFAPA
jgi:hypothetical protein